jgi:hypothetical protein
MNTGPTGLFNVHPNALIKHGYNATGAPPPVGMAEPFMISGGGPTEDVPSAKMSVDHSKRASKISSVPRSNPTTRQIAPGFLA